MPHHQSSKVMRRCRRKVQRWTRDGGLADQDAERCTRRKDEGMPLQLAAAEPEAGPWPTESLSALVQSLSQQQPGRAESRRAVIVAIDGRSNSAKTSLAARLAQAVPRSVVIHTDDIAWEHSRFGW